MNKKLNLLTLLCLVSRRCGVSVAVPCSPGERLHTPRFAEAGDVCIPCDKGTFMPERDHLLRECYNCSKIENPETDKLITECNRTHDTTIGCISGYYRLKAETVLDKDKCVECGKCESGFPARPCQGYNDTVCCPLYHDAVLTSQGTIECWERPTCEAGMYYNTSLRRCMSCSNGTYMQARDHTNLACIKCETLSGNTSNHAAIQQSCSRTSPTIFGCEEFHFRVNNKASMLEEVPCRPYAGQDVNETVPSNSIDVPESQQLKPCSHTSIFEISIMFIGEILVYLLFVSIYCEKHASAREEGQNMGAILRETRKLWREYYLYPLMVLIIFRVLFVLNYSGVFYVFTEYNISNTLIMAAIFTAVLFSVYLTLRKFIKAWLKACLNYVWGMLGVFWGYVAASTSAKKGAQKCFNRRRFSGEEVANNRDAAQTEPCIAHPQNSSVAPPNDPSL